MTDRIKGFAVVLDHDIRADDAEAVVNAIAMIKGVISVQAITRDIDDILNREQIRYELRRKLLEALKDEP